uniref:Uncharacterized protein n=1 Tax=Aegilops tauschii subsp. strangulata TaxID=200361 RepID=A0A452ZMI3_AEGTS
MHSTCYFMICFKFYITLSSCGVFLILLLVLLFAILLPLKSTQGTWFTPTYQWPDNSLSFGVAHAVAWKKSGLMMRPSTQVSVCPTLGGSDPGIRAEIVHSLKEEIGVSCGFSCSRHPSAFTSLSIGRSKLNGEVGSSGVVVTMEKPLDNVGSPSLSVQLNGGLEF